MIAMDGSAAGRRRFWIIALLVLAVFAGMFLRYSNRGPKRNYSDFRVYYATAQKVLKSEPIYSRPDQAITPYKYSPMFAWLLAPLALMPIHAASLAFFCVNFACLIGILYWASALCPDRFKPQTQRSRSWVLILTLVFCLRFILKILDAGQVNILMIAMLTFGLYLLSARREFWGSSMIALSVMVKYVTFIFIPYWLLKRQYRRVFYTLIWVGIFCVLPIIFSGLERGIADLTGWMPYITRESLDRGSWMDEQNQSLYSLVLRLFAKESPHLASGIGLGILRFEDALMVAFVVACALYTWIAFSLWKRPDGEPWTLAMLYIALAFLNPNAWALNFVSLILPIWFLLAYWRSTQDRWMIGLLTASFLLFNLPSDFFGGERWQIMLEAASFTTLGALVVLVALWRAGSRTGTGIT